MSEAAAAAAPGDPVWDDWSEPPRVPSVPVLHLDGFDGPMDLLLDLAERQRIDLGRMSVLALAEQFVAAMARVADTVPIERRANWVVLATRLVLLRSRLLFPANPAEAETAQQDAAAEERRIETMAAMRAAAAWLQARPQLGLDVFAHPAAEAAPAQSGYVALMEACLVALRGRDGRPAEALLYRPVVPDLWRIPDALVRIRALLVEHPEGGGFARFLPPIAPDAADRTLRARAAVASTLVAGLELAREEEVVLDQDAGFTPIYLSSTSGAPPV